MSFLRNLHPVFQSGCTNLHSQHITSSLVHVGGSVSWASSFSSGYDLAVCEFGPHIRLCADSSEPRACFRFYVSLSLCPSPTRARALSLSLSKNKHLMGAWVAQSVGQATTAQVMIWRSVSSSPMSGSVLTAQSLEPASVSMSPSLSAPPPLMLALYLSQTSKKNFFKSAKPLPTSLMLVIGVEISSR